MKRSDISDYEILSCIKEQKDTPDVILGKKYPFKVIMAKMEQLENRGYLDCGVSLRTAWLTNKGKEYLKGMNKNNNKEDKWK